MRGKVPMSQVYEDMRGITPAYAGKSLTAVLLIHGGRDHPRLCGEKACMCAIGGVTAGSPPPMRGKAWVRGTSNNRKGITPAYAGKSRGRSRFRLLSKDHPRLCGEKASHHTACVHAARITPAYAGKSFFSMHRHYKCQDHPRLCGEKIYFPF